jgi:DNA-binding transcriptional LysR family regulator
MSGIQYAAEAGLGIAELPEFICAKALQDSRLVEVMPSWRFLPTKLSALYPSNRNTSRLVKLFLSFCVTHVEQYIPR